MFLPLLSTYSPLVKQMTGFFILLASHRSVMTDILLHIMISQKQKLGIPSSPVLNTKLQNYLDSHPQALLVSVAVRRKEDLKMSEVCGIICDMKREGETLNLAAQCSANYSSIKLCQCMCSLGVIT